VLIGLGVAAFFGLRLSQTHSTASTATIKATTVVTRR